MKIHARALGLAAVLGFGSSVPMHAASSPFLAKQDLVAPEDDATTAYSKLLNAVSLGRGSRDEFQYACRDFCARFPEDSHYVAVRRLAVSAGKLGKYRDWDPADAERDPKLDAEQRAGIAKILAERRGSRRHRADGADAELAQFLALVEALRPHAATTLARETLITAASLAPAQHAVPILRELYPDDAEARACIATLENIGQPFAFEFTALDGRKVRSRDYHGKVVVLSFWAKGCGSSVAALPKLKELAEELGPRGLVVVGVNLDQDRSQAEEIIRRLDLPWPHQFSENGWANVLAARLSVSSIPRCAVIDRDGRLRFMISSVDGLGAAERLRSVVAEPTGSP